MSAVPKIDWISVSTAVIDGLRRHHSTSKSEPSRPPPRTAALISYEDLVQEVIAEQLEAWENGEPIPASIEEIKQALIIRAARTLNTWSKRERRRRDKLDEIQSSPIDMFNDIAARNEFNKLIELLFDAVDPTARVLLHLVLNLGIPWSSSQALLDRINAEVDRQMKMTMTDVENAKRRLVYHARIILAQLRSPRSNGSQS